MARLFISQERIDRWSGEGKVTLDGDVMTLPALGRSFRLRPAVYVTRAAADGDDPNRLVGRVKTDDQILALRAENYATTLVVGDLSYDCEPGYLGEIVGGGSQLGPDGGIDPLA